MNTENLLNKKVTETMSGHLQHAEYEAFFKMLEPLENNAVLEGPVSDIREEWRKLQIARRNGLMDDEQINLALIAYFNRKQKDMIRLQEEAGNSN